MQKRTYYIPTIEVTILETTALMWDLETSNSMGDHAPARRESGDMKSY